MAITDNRAYRLALDGAVDTGAPARATGTIDIDASRDSVWNALTHVENWPSIRGDISNAQTFGPAATASSFSWHAGGIPISSAFALVERPTRLTWANAAPGLDMACVYEFDELGPERTRIRCEESMDAAVAAPHIDDRALAESIRTWLEGVKAFVEGRTRLA